MVLSIIVIICLPPGTPNCNCFYVAMGSGEGIRWEMVSGRWGGERIHYTDSGYHLWAGGRKGESGLNLSVIYLPCRPQQGLLAFWGAIEVLCGHTNTSTFLIGLGPVGGELTSRFLHSAPGKKPLPQSW